MEIIHSPRASGKTVRLIEWLRENPNRILVTFSDLEARRLKEMPASEGMEKRIKSWREYASLDMMGMGKPDEFEVAIDNADIILHRYSRYPIKIISVTKDE